MEKNNEFKLMYDMISAGPGMNVVKKVSITMSRQTILLLCQALKCGLGKANDIEREMLKFASPDAIQELESSMHDWLAGADLVELWSLINKKTNT